ncbi:MAG TPA: T9SS type A sorting domain-containing protein [Bacteroidia bacterium]|nr:T9SS type A sorting domain-containing protein [Bacteroidia bacterium]HRS58216.1 T9SS type A sorting domain-containing protein [Bacteroidia bacterium]
MMKKVISLIFFFLLLGHVSLFSQELVTPLNENVVLQKIKPDVYRNYRSADTIRLINTAFFDDFSGSSPYPNDSLWLDRYVFINSTMAYHSPTYHVATFDGLNEFGNPYNPVAPNSKGNIADKLTSTYIDLSPFSESDSIYLSFFFQPKGLGDEPESYDSLVLEFKPSRYWNGTLWDSNAWVRVWSVKGSPRKDFRQVIIPVKHYLIDTSQITDTIANFYHDAFQFRFKNYANLSGNLDHWHITYVYLNRNRSRADTFYKDVAITQRPVSILKNYTSMPWMHFKGNKSMLRQTMKIDVHNFWNKPMNLMGRLNIYDMADTSLILATGTDKVFYRKDTSLTVAFNLPDSLNLGSIVTADTVRLKSVLRNKQTDNSLTNNETFTYNEFVNYYAYDDGSAEMGYGISGTKYAKVANYFKIAPFISSNDSLRGVYIYFNRAKEYVGNTAFNILVWDKGDYNTVPVSYQARVPVITADEPNDFHLFVFDSALSVKNSVYIGWEQNSEFYMNIGVDMNYYRLNEDTFPNVPNPNVFYYVNNQWKPSSSLYGALMIRPVFAENPIGNIKHTAQKTEKPLIYPNPASNRVYISGKPDAIYRFYIYDIQGKIQHQGRIEQQMIDVKGLTEGVYFLRLIDEENNSQFNYKLLIK